MEPVRDQNFATTHSYGHSVQDEEYEFECDSELGEDVDIDETGNVLHAAKRPQVTSPTHQSLYPDVLAHILAGYGTEICEQVIGEFL